MEPIQDPYKNLLEMKHHYDVLEGFRHLEDSKPKYSARPPVQTTPIMKNAKQGYKLQPVRENVMKM